MVPCGWIMGEKGGGLHFFLCSLNMVLNLVAAVFVGIANSLQFAGYLAAYFGA